MKAAAPLLAVLFAASAGSPALAQYQWRDSTGRMVYSDRAPPPEVPSTRIVRVPLSVDRQAVTASPAAPVPDLAPPPVSARTGLGGDKATAPSAPKTYRDLEMAFRKRRAEREEQERKQQADAAVAQKRAAACARLSADLRALESGIRITEVGADGGRQIVGDDDRARRVTSTRRDISEQCGKS